MAEDEHSYELYSQGRAAMDRGDLEAAVKLFQKSCDETPHFKTFELLGECLLKLGKPEDAIVSLGAAVGLGSKPFRALYLLAKTLEQTGRIPDAIEKLDLALQINPNYKAAGDLRSQLERQLPGTSRSCNS